MYQECISCLQMSKERIENLFVYFVFLYCNKGIKNVRNESAICNYIIYNQVLTLTVSWRLDHKL